MTTIKVGDYVQRKRRWLNRGCWGNDSDAHRVIDIYGNEIELADVKGRFALIYFDLVDPPLDKELERLLAKNDEILVAIEHTRAAIAAASAPKPGEVYHNAQHTDSFTVLDVYKGRVYGRREAPSEHQGMIQSASTAITKFATLWPNKVS